MFSKQILISKIIKIRGKEENIENLKDEKFLFLRILFDMEFTIMKRFVSLLFLSLLSICLFAQDKVVKKVISLGQSDNRTMEFDDFLANRIGGRLIGSHALEDAEEWVAEQFRSWGLEVMVQEVGEINVGFNRGPWFGRMLSEEGMILNFGTPSYTAGTKGPEKGPALIEPKDQREFDRIKGKLKGAWVLTDYQGKGFPVNPADTAHMFVQMMEAGVRGFIMRGERPFPVLYDRRSCRDITMDSLPTVCNIILDADQYDLIEKKAARKDDFLLEFDIRNHFNRGPVKYHNVIGIIRGSKYPDEYVLVGGHLDAYDSASGAVDDGNGVAVTMETARLLALSGAKPLRTIMFCVWTGEEFGLLGSKFFVQNGTVPLEKISNYFNRDGGPTVATGITVPQAMYEDLKKVCEPILNVNPDFPFTVNIRTGEPRPIPTKGGGSDHAYFARNGVPTISFDLTDPKGYGFDYRQIWHTQRDLYYQVIPEYMEHSSIVSAVVVYGLANLNHILSREGLYKEKSE